MKGNNKMEHVLIYWNGKSNNGHEFKMEFSHVLPVHVIGTKQYMYNGPE